MCGLRRKVATKISVLIAASIWKRSKRTQLAFQRRWLICSLKLNVPYCLAGCSSSREKINALSTALMIEPFSVVTSTDTKVYKSIWHRVKYTIDRKQKKLSSHLKLKDASIHWCLVLRRIVDVKPQTNCLFVISQSKTIKDCKKKFLWIHLFIVPLRCCSQRHAGPTERSDELFITESVIRWSRPHE